MKEWNIGVDSWIIQDGNYEDFNVGQIVEFALEFYPHKIELSSSQNRTVSLIGDSRYKINGEIVFIEDKLWIIDFGICAFQESYLPSNSKVGDFISADIYLGIDYYVYFESLYKIQGIPPLIYNWNIKKIFQQTAPFIESELEGRKVLIRDEKKLGYKEIQITNAWTDDNGSAHYILQCDKFDDTPKFKINSSIK